MKVPKPSFILNSLVNKGPLPHLSVEETECTLKCAEERYDHIALSSDSARTLSIQTYQPLNSIGVAHGETVYQNSPFKLPSTRSFQGGSVNSKGNVQSTPKALPKLVNLSFSQPNSPRTPCVRTKARMGLATPCQVLNHFTQNRLVDQSELSTPCVMGALHELQMAQDSGLPDMLALIEDERSGLSQVERQLLWNTEMELTDHTVVDYLLDVAQEDPCPQGVSQTPLSGQSQPTVRSRTTVEKPECELNVRRKRRRRSQKRMTAEEAIIIRRQRSKRPTRAAATVQQPSVSTPQHTSSAGTPQQTSSAGTPQQRYSVSAPQQTCSVGTPEQTSPVGTSRQLMSAGTSEETRRVRTATPGRRTQFTLRRSTRTRRQASRFEVSW